MSTPASDLAQTPRPANSVYFPALDGLRTLAFVAVFLDHYMGIAILGLGVNVFFVLSGFLITGILLDTRDQPHRVRNFYVRRTLRIFPLYYAVFVVLLLLTPVMHWRWNSAWSLWPAYLGNYLMYLPEWLPRAEWMHVSNGQLFGAGGVVLQLGHFWTLCFEEQFYLIWPWFVFTRSRKFLFWFVGAVLVFEPIARYIAELTFPPAAIRAGVLYRTMPFASDALLWGALLALLLRSQYRRQMIAAGRTLAYVLVPLALAYLLFFIDLHLPGWQPPLARFAYGGQGIFTAVDLLSAALLLAALEPGGPLYAMLNLKPLRWLGRISYGLYVFHNIPHGIYGEWARRIAPNHFFAALYAIAAAMTLLLATVSYYCFERPILKLKDRWTVRA
jgi:peptidoglycan/LPS O-acetylase OafA/YrhL